MRRILIHIPKTGCNTLQREPRLRDVLVDFGPKQMPAGYVAQVWDQMTRYNLKPQWKHCRWRDLSREFTDQHDAVAIVRNPWSKLVSQYRFALKINREQCGKNPLAVPLTTTFDEFITDILPRWRSEPYFWHRTTIGFYPQMDHVTASNGVLCCDVLRFEHHAEDTMAYFDLDSPIERRNVTGEPYDYRDFYGPKTRQMVEDWFKVDVAFFGFTFDGTATRNVWEGCST